MPTQLFERLLIATLVGGLAIMCLFVSFPNIDIAASRLFTNANGVFFLQGNAVIVGINDALKVGQNLFFIFIILIACLSAIRGQPLQSGTRNLWFAVIVYVLGPGLIVNAILKAGVHRARPYTIMEFGGDKIFTPMMQVTDQCARNCSFSSGEVALTTSFVLVAITLLWSNLSKSYKVYVCAFAATLILISMTTRIGLGRHFLSDSLFSIFICALIVIIAAQILRIGEVSGSFTLPAIRADLRSILTRRK